MDLRRAPAWIHNVLSQELISPWQGAVAVEDYQLYPVYKALEMPRVSLFSTAKAAVEEGVVVGGVTLLAAQEALEKLELPVKRRPARGS
jgi:hypothetical protein